MVDESVSNVALAFGLTLAASLATSIGGAASFFAKLQDHRLLASSLGCSAGVMLYVSFVEIFSDSKKHFETSSVKGYGSPLLLSTLFFFVGVIVVILLDMLVHKLNPHHEEEDLKKGRVDSKIYRESSRSMSRSPQKQFDFDVNSEFSGVAVDSGEFSLGSMTMNSDGLIPETDHKLKRASMITALAVGIHNFPEGLATFIATLDDPKIGLSVSIAIALHNIPEGVCVAMPLYFATGSRLKAFLWASASGFSAFIGAVIGYLALRGHFSDFVFGMVFAIICGMMVTVSMRELLPVARRYDPMDSVVSKAVLVGMLVMAVSLVVFEL